MANKRLNTVLITVIGLVCSVFGVVCEPTVIAPGVTYKKIVCSEPVPLEIHEVVIDTRRASILPVLAHDTYGSAATTSSIARQKKASVAINGGFFKLSESSWKEKILMALDCCGYRHAHALPVYGLKINGEWLSLSTQPTGFLGWKNGGENVVCGVMKTNWHVAIGGQLFGVKDINKKSLGESVLYMPAYTSGVTPRAFHVVDVVVSSDHVSEIKKGGGTKIPADGYVYACNRTTDLSAIKIGDEVHVVRDYCSENGQKLDDDLDAMDHLIASTPLLLKDGEVLPLIEQEQMSTFFIKRHPRTAIGLLPSGEWLLLVVDGRQKRALVCRLKNLPII